MTASSAGYERTGVLPRFGRRHLALAQRRTATCRGRPSREVGRNRNPRLLSVTVAEVEQGVRKGEEGRTRAFLRALRAHPVDHLVAERAGELVRGLRSRGITVGLADAIIAATCLVHGLTLVTLKVADFERVEGLVLEAVL